ncbi:MAG TPA: hypothetical protein VFR47_32540, partial [Anaerolineales bacterium]|nr:hypothetical protein [Anaerolineales bacterium]
LPNGEIPPSYTHTGEYEIPIGNDKYHPGRFFAINSYFFHIFFRPEATHERIWKKFIQRVPLLIPGATQLHRMKHKVTIKASNINTLQANKDFLKSHESAYLKWKSTKQN